MAMKCWDEGGKGIGRIGPRHGTKVELAAFVAEKFLEDSVDCSCFGDLCSKKSQ